MFDKNMKTTENTMKIIVEGVTRDIVAEMDLVRVCGEVESDVFDDFMEIFLDSDEVDIYLTEIDLREAARAERIGATAT